MTTLERNPRRTRWLHAAAYLLTVAALGTGWWLRLGQEGRPSLLARALGYPDIEIHKIAGWATAALAVVALVAGRRGVLSFVRHSLTFSRREAGWFVGWPPAIVTGRFRSHEGRFDPGQRIANVVMVGGLLLITATGIGLVGISGGPVFVVLRRMHVWGSLAVTPVIVGHVLVASGVLPGYRGVWRAMHGRGRVHEDVARRLWPLWTERHLSEREGVDD